MKKLILFLCIFSLSLFANADEVFGVVDDFRYEEAVIVIDDNLYKMAINMKVTDQKGNEVPRIAIKNKQKVMYQWVKPKTAERKIITAIKFLPKNAERPEN